MLADALPKLAPDLLDEATDELMFLKDPKTVPAIGKFIVAPEKAASRRCVKPCRFSH